VADFLLIVTFWEENQIGSPPKKWKKKRLWGSASDPEVFKKTLWATDIDIKGGTYKRYRPHASGTIVAIGSLFSVALSSTI
jgi:hypothetical protein